jgi:predicted house-cleaning noncanonical NTP pyrophosphatase (MazG superfamily)
MDRLRDVFRLREEFMIALREKNISSHPAWPLDLSDKVAQQHVRDMALRGVEEMFEALQHLKNWKPHRDTEITEFNQDEFLEEVVDAFNYFFSLLILVGFDEDEFYDAYVKKDKIIHGRLKTGY